MKQGFVPKVVLGLICILAVMLLFDTARLAWVRIGLFHAEAGYAAGPKDADLKILQFVDYGDSRARALEPFLRDALRRDGHAVLIPRPVYTPGDEQSRKAAMLVYAAGAQGKFIEAHRALLSDFRAIDNKFLNDFAQALDLDALKLEQDLNDPALMKQIERNRTALRTLKSEVTPTFLFGPKVMVRIYKTYPDTSGFLALFKQGRSV